MESGRSPPREGTRLKLIATLGLVALLAAVAFRSVHQRPRVRAAPELLAYQGRVGELSPQEQERFALIQKEIRQAERARAATHAWPNLFEVPGLPWVHLGTGLYVNYLGIPAEPDRLRWLVLFIEPEPAALKEPAPPEDLEHHTLSDGTALHVSVWTAENTGPVSTTVLPFPAAENWTQRVQ